MAIVGTAFVRLKVISDKLSGDIKNAVERSVRDSAPDLESSGGNAGEHIAQGVNEALADGISGDNGPLRTRAEEVGDLIAQIIANTTRRSFRRRAQDAIVGGLRNLRGRVQAAGDELGDAFSTFSTSIKKQAKKLNLGGLLISGLGVLITVLPSILSGAGAIIGAYLASAVSAISALGPAAAGAALAGVAAFSALKISTSLFKLAMDTTTPALEDFQERAANLKAEIASPVQAGLLPHLNAGLRLVTPLVAALQDQFRTFGDTVGNVISNLAEMVANAENTARIQSIMATNNTFLAQAGVGVQGLVQGFIILLNALKPVYDFFGPLIADMGTWVANTLAAKEASGELAAFITRSLDALRQFGGIVTDLGIGIYNVFRAANPAGQSLLDSLEGIAARFREWTGDEANQQRMTTFFLNMRQIIAQVNDILGQLVGSGLRALEGTDLGALNRGLETLRSFGAPLAQMFNAIKENAGPALQEAFQNFADVFVQLANSGVIGILAQAFGNLLEIVSQVLAIPGVGTILAFVAGLAVLLKTVGLLVTVLGFLGPAFTLIRAVASILVTAFGIVPIVIAAVVAALVYFFTQTELGREIIAKVWEFIKNAISTAIDAIITAFHAVVDALSTAASFIATTAQEIWSAISDAFNAVLDTVTSVWNSIVNAVQTAITTVQNVISTVISAVVAYVTPILNNIQTVFSTVFGVIQTVVQTALNIIYEIWIRIFPILLLPLRVFEGLAILAWQAISNGISIAVNFISNIVTTVWNAIYGFLSFIVTQIQIYVTTTWDNITSAVSTAVNAVSAVISAVWNAIMGFLLPIVESIRAGIATAWEAISSAVSTAMTAVNGVVTSVWNAVSGFVSGVVNSIRSTVSSVWNSITDSISTAMNRARDIISNIWDAIQTRVSSAVTAVQNLVSNVWSGLQNVGSGILSGLRSAVNSVIGAVNSVIGGLNFMINAANNLPGIDIPNIPDIPRLAKGGVVSPSSGGTLAMIAEAGKSERVEPLDSSGLSKRDRAIITKLSAEAGGGRGDTHVLVTIGGREILDYIVEVVEDETSAIGDVVLTGRKG